MDPKLKVKRKVTQTAGRSLYLTKQRIIDCDQIPVFVVVFLTKEQGLFNREGSKKKSKILYVSYVRQFSICIRFLLIVTILTCYLFSFKILNSHLVQSSYRNLYYSPCGITALRFIYNLQDCTGTVFPLCFPLY